MRLIDTQSYHWNACSNEVKPNLQHHKMQYTLVHHSDATGNGKWCWQHDSCLPGSPPPLVWVSSEGGPWVGRGKN